MFVTSHEQSVWWQIASRTSLSGLSTTFAWNVPLRDVSTIRLPPKDPSLMARMRSKTYSVSRDSGLPGGVQIVIRCSSKASVLLAPLGGSGVSVRSADSETPAGSTGGSVSTAAPAPPEAHPAIAMPSMHRTSSSRSMDSNRYTLPRSLSRQQGNLQGAKIRYPPRTLRFSADHIENFVDWPVRHVDMKQPLKARADFQLAAEHRISDHPQHFPGV